jgi:hypothetical protein
VSGELNDVLRRRRDLISQTTAAFEEIPAPSPVAQTALQAV